MKFSWNTRIPPLSAWDPETKSLRQLGWRRTRGAGCYGSEKEHVINLQFGRNRRDYVLENAWVQKGLVSRPFDAVVANFHENSADVPEVCSSVQATGCGVLETI